VNAAIVIWRPTQPPWAGDAPTSANSYPAPAGRQTSYWSTPRRPSASSSQGLRTATRLTLSGKSIQQTTVYIRGYT